MKRSKIIFGILAALLIFICGLLIAAYRLMYLPLPVYEGEYDLSGLDSEVKIYRDSLAIPHIIADSEKDAAFAIGYVHAQERMFQMDLMRRAGEGRLSEIFGNKTVPFDRMFRTVGLRNIVDRHYPYLSDTTKSLLDSYANGVNEYLSTQSKHSLEFEILGYTPEKWQPQHSLLVAKLMAWELNISWWTDIMFSHLVQKFGKSKASEILPGFDENAPTIIPDDYSNFGKIDLNFIKTDKKFRSFMNMQGTHIGSNNWVVNNKKSVSGKTIIANDPHLAFALPGKWFLAVIRANKWQVEGFTLPGVPAVVIGKNQSIAWALTNVMTDDADFYIEKLNSSETKYLVNNKWKNLRVFRENISVKDSSDVSITIKSTHRGPIVSEIHAFNVLFPDSTYQNKAEISMRWTAQDFSDELIAIYKVNRAKNWEQFKSALKDFTVPGQNFVYGDSKNNIGYVCAAKLPIRKSPSPTLIYDGTTTEYDWKGFVKYDEMPKLYNPEKNYIASANNKTIKDFPFHISNIWEPSSRINRISEILEANDTLSVHICEDLQNDFYSYYAKKILKRFFIAFHNINITNSNMKHSLNILREWNFIMDKYQQAPTIYLTFYQKLIENLFKDEMGQQLFDEYVFIANVPYRMVEEICAGSMNSWIDDVTTSKKETLDDIMRKSLVDALNELESQLGENIAEWQWYKLHTVTLKHPFSGISSLIDNLVDIGPFPISGSGTTVFNTEYSFTEPYEVKLGPSMRYIYDFADSNKFHFSMPSGQSGHIMSENYDNTTEYWLNGKYHSINLSLDEMDLEFYKLLVLR